MGQIGQIGQIGQTRVNAWGLLTLFFFWFLFGCGGFLVDHVVYGAAYECVALGVHGVELV